MAGTKISELPSATTPLTGAELVPVVQSGITDKVTVANVLGTASGASLIVNTPAGNVAATTVQAAINELDTEKASLAALAASSGSTLVGYTQGGTGATTRTVKAKLQESVSVLDFGADPTGVSDSTAAIQAAINVAASIGGAVFFPSGIYLISSSLTNSANGVSLIGVNGTAIWNGVTTVYQAGSVIIKKSTMTTDAIINTGLRFSVHDLALVGQTGNTGDGISIQNGQSCVIANVSVAKMGGSGIRLGTKSGSIGNVNGWILNGVTSQYNGSHGVYIYDQSTSGGPNANGGTATALNVAGNSGDGLHIENGVYNTFTGLLSQQNTGYGVNVVGAVGLSLYNVFSGGDVESNTAGQWSLGGNAVHLTFIGGSTFVPATVNPNNFQVALSDAVSTLRTLKFSASGTQMDTYIHQAAFTPTLYGLTTAGSNTYTWQYGYYSQIGKVVNYYGIVRLATKDAAMAGNIAISGLPSASWNNTLNRAQAQINAESTTLGAGFSNFYGMVYENTTYIQLFKNNNTAGSNVAVAAADITASTIIYFSGSYQVQ